MSSKNDLLGESFGAASHKLRKALLYKYVVSSRDNICFKCGLEIISITEFTIEHKIPWQNSDNEVVLFFDLDNIAFSHKGCNLRRRSPQTHCRKGHELLDGQFYIEKNGTRRCKQCNTLQQRVKRQKKRDALRDRGDQAAL